MRQIKVLVCLFALLPIVGCFSKQTVKLTNASGTRTLEYNCRDIKPQAESSDDAEIIFNSVVKAMDELLEQGKTVSATELARSNKLGIRIAEMNVVAYECKKSRQSSK